jgi:hypothetical protein
MFKKVCEVIIGNCRHGFHQCCIARYLVYAGEKRYLYDYLCLNIFFYNQVLISASNAMFSGNKKKKFLLFNLKLLNGELPVKRILSKYSIYTLNFACFYLFLFQAVAPASIAIIER